MIYVVPGPKNLKVNGSVNLVGNFAVECFKGFIIKFGAFLALSETFRKFPISNFFSEDRRWPKI